MLPSPPATPMVVFTSLQLHGADIISTTTQRGTTASTSPSTQMQVMTVLKRKVACSSCRHLKTRCTQPPEIGPGDALRSCLRCVGYGQRCAAHSIGRRLLENDVLIYPSYRCDLAGQSDPQQLGLVPRLSAQQQALKLALNPSSTQGRLFVHELSTALSYHLITTHLDGSALLRVGQSQTFENLR